MPKAIPHGQISHLLLAYPRPYTLLCSGPYRFVFWFYVVHMCVSSLGCEWLKGINYMFFNSPANLARGLT